MRIARSIMFVCVFSLAAGSGCSSEPEQTPDVEPTPEQSIRAVQIDNAVKYRIELQQLQYVDDKCHWLDATSRVALDITEEEQVAWVLDKASAEALDAPEIFNQARAKAETTTCDDQDWAMRFRLITWQQRATWALRAQALLEGEGRPAWFATQSPVLAYRDALEETVDALKKQYQRSITEIQPQFEAEAAQLLSLLCPNAPHECPLEETDTDVSKPYGKAYAAVWVQKTAVFAEALAKDPVKLPPMPGAEENAESSP